MRVGATLLLVELLVSSTGQAKSSDGQSVLRSAARAMGRFNPGTTVELRGSINAEGRSGDYHEVVRMRDGAYVVRAKYKLFSEGDGFDGRVRWKLDRSEATHRLQAPFTKAETVSLAWLKRRGYFQSGSARIERVEHETIGGRPATVLSMRPRGGSVIHLAFDDTTHMLVRSQRDRPLSTITEIYTNYRPVGPSKVPFNIDIEENGEHQMINASSYLPLARSAPVRFAEPPPPRDTVIAGPSTVPLQASGFAVVPATINGRTYDFILDTGGHNIVTPEIAAELGLESEGQGSSGGSGPGRAPTSDTQIAELKLGSATMKNQHFTILSLGNAVKRKDKPPMAGILGLEIFERMAVTVDEPGGRLTIEPFEPGRACEGDKVPLLFDDDQPSVHGSIDGIPAFIGIDVGNGGIPIVLWRWAEAHGVADRFRKGVEGSGSGVGGNNTTFRTPDHTIVIGRTALRDIDVNYAETKTGYFSSRADSANVGRALLKEYVVRFDYAQGHMCIIPPSATKL